MNCFLPCEDRFHLSYLHWDSVPTNEVVQIIINEFNNSIIRLNFVSLSKKIEFAVGEYNVIMEEGDALVVTRVGSRIINIKAMPIAVFHEQYNIE